MLESSTATFFTGSASPRWWWSVTSTWARPASSTGFARMFLTATIRPPSEWTLKSSALRLLGSPTASRSGTQQGKRSSSASHLPTTGVPRLLAFPTCAAIITAFDLTDVQTLEHTRQWLEDALRENEPGSCFIFLVGTKKDLLSRAACEQAEVEAVHLAKEMQAEYWSVSAKTGENVKAFFSRVAALAFEQSVLQHLERRSGSQPQVGDGDLIHMEGSPSENQESKRPSGPGCC
ncbi:RAB36, member RAS oncogene family [Phyllostomus discolor]|uniref:RAB36, member RAS oncogene family n=1 Tax=Phyllostomus discolor TaxID=89673 RepID=A0A833YY10_9CHIR|nr:RAB36, member RAS oncogene family [Phyllostomus discolor]